MTVRRESSYYSVAVLVLKHAYRKDSVRSQNVNKSVVHVPRCAHRKSVHVNSVKRAHAGWFYSIFRTISQIPSALVNKKREREAQLLTGVRTMQSVFAEAAWTVAVAAFSAWSSSQM